MKKLAAFGIVCLTLAMVPTEASAWFCRARAANNATGWGRSDSLARARAIALGECRARGRACYIVFCR